MVLAALQRGKLKRTRRGAPAVSRQRLRHTRTGAMFQLRSRWPKLVASMNESEHDVLAYMNFPTQHRTKPRSASPRPVRPKCFTVAINRGSTQRTLRLSRRRTGGAGRVRNSSASRASSFSTLGTRNSMSSQVVASEARLPTELGPSTAVLLCSLLR
jgi:hypothetical protein